MSIAYSYSLPRKVLHWLTVVLVVAALGLIWGREAFDDPAQRMLLLQFHRLAGLLVGLCASLRLVLRLAEGASPPPAGASRLEHLAARLMHDAFYPILITLPLLGWAYTSAKGRPFDLFAVVQLPALTAKDPALAELLAEAHEALAYALVAAVALHAGAALFHTFVRRDGVLGRMSFSKSL